MANPQNTTVTVQYQSGGILCAELCHGCSAVRWAIAARAFLCICTVGISEAVRGKDGWCAPLFDQPMAVSVPASTGHGPTASVQVQQHQQPQEQKPYTQAPIPQPTMEQQAFTQQPAQSPHPNTYPQAAPQAGQTSPTLAHSRISSFSYSSSPGAPHTTPQPGHQSPPNGVNPYGYPSPPPEVAHPTPQTGSPSPPNPVAPYGYPSPPANTSPQTAPGIQQPYPPAQAQQFPQPPYQQELPTQHDFAPYPQSTYQHPPMPPASPPPPSTVYYQHQHQQQQQQQQQPQQSQVPMNLVRGRISSPPPSSETPLRKPIIAVHAPQPQHPQPQPQQMSHAASIQVHIGSAPAPTSAGPARPRSSSSSSNSS
ncbi:hypothetical protein AJ80_00327 [Polytolypa hystricis UAMH7299]|uniref:Uncharacterized protein n=1 Tax=Polytolypa hystricis (strain UAMH7299) TaxID=1447883 RepID=A0A2B7Z3Y4_POLH7|nr:hypothetical protein AJ80_00327 [Polytolypa hystricis UAMH7299]